MIGTPLDPESWVIMLVTSNDRSRSEGLITHTRMSKIARHLISRDDSVPHWLPIAAGDERHLTYPYIVYCTCVPCQPPGD